MNLNEAEKAFLIRLLKEQIEYYRILAGSTKASTQTLLMHTFLETLFTKLRQ